jgi:thioredoxin-dependent peroxiredoxin
MADEKATSAAGPAVGQPAPDFTLPNQTGEMVSLASLRGKPVVLYFYPKDDTPGCTKEACSFRDAWRELQAKGVVVLGVSKDSVRDHQKFAEKYGLPFPLLADESTEVSQKYGTWGEQSFMGQKYMGVARKTFYIRPDGTIGYVWEKVKPDGHAEEVLAVVSQDIGK